MLRCKEARYFWFSVCWHLQDTTEGRFCLPPFCPYYVYAILGESGRIVCPRYALYVSRQYLRLEGAKPCPPGGPFLVGSRLAAWALPPARLRRSGGHPAACPVLAPTAGAPRGASAVCALVSAPPGGPPGGGRSPLRASARGPARGPGPRLSGGRARPPPLASAYRRGRAPVARVRAAPRRPRRSLGGLPLRPFGPPLGGGAGLSPLRARPGSFASPGRPGPPARPAASGGGFALAPPARGPGAPPRSPPPRVAPPSGDPRASARVFQPLAICAVISYFRRALRRRSRSLSLRSKSMSAIA